MTTVTFQVLEGVDKGRVFRHVPTPLTIGREEGNLLRLNDERISRFHAKVQQDNGDIVLTDLESTNGTRVNGNVVQIRRLRLGDRISLGRSLLLFGSNEEIAARMATLASVHPSTEGTVAASGLAPGPATLPVPTYATHYEQELEFDLNVKDEITIAEGNLFIGTRQLPPLPQKLSPAQAARLAEIFDFLHRGLTAATENIRSNEEGTEISVGFADWQKALAVQMLLARYLRAVAEPDALVE
ncbi:MAG TPA: FHA domain-containing protein [Gemmataceae bacterium]|jgi:pSer/pThr/pTyr-binding forkhead associated (FHA) protein|nr:FHA domain-containing protein [Gemmataceae bacterium]